jgi:Trk K+ transport system NAD-binding subunit
LLLLPLQVVAIGTDEEKCKEIEKQYEGVTGVAVDAKDIKQVRDVVHMCVAYCSNGQ